MDSPSSGASQTQRSSIPLFCNICLKKPSFSDLSHLLTHISSKAHLSTYFKIKVRSASDDSSRQLIEEYNTWYARYEIESLMSDRLSMKEEKKRIKIKTEPRSTERAAGEMEVAENVPNAVTVVDPTALYPYPFTGFAPMYNWSSLPYAIPTRPQGPFSDEEDNRGQNEAASKRLGKQPVKMEEGGDDDESSKLKGILWPGMGLFDAATPEHKKKRNQKKDVSVNDRLASMSEIVEKTEMVFSPGGSLSKVRSISGQVDSDDDLLPGEQVPPRPRKPKRAGRQDALEDGSVGARMTRTVPRRTRKRNRKQQETAPDPDGTTEVATENDLTCKPGRNKRVKVADDRDDGASDSKLGSDVAAEQAGDMPHLTSAYYQAPMYVPATAMGFRPADGSYMGQSYYQFSAGTNNPFTYDPSPLMTWDYLGYGLGPAIANPLFQSGGSGGFEDDGEDNQETISAPASESEK